MKTIENLIENLNLNNPQKIQLIELLLLISSILVALKPVQGLMLYFFMLFIFLSISYYIIVQKNKSNFWGERLIVLFISASFTSFVNVNMITGFINSSPDIPFAVVAILYTIYYVAFTFILSIALIRIKDDNLLY